MCHSGTHEVGILLSIIISNKEKKKRKDDEPNMAKTGLFQKVKRHWTFLLWRNCENVVVCKYVSRRINCKRNDRLRGEEIKKRQMSNVKRHGGRAGNLSTPSTASPQLDANSISQFPQQQRVHHMCLCARVYMCFTTT
ncbi:hypothetical protein CEXT_646431 [Caerostris extrusa]|uniref:Uncharacterized protein n=1 Tax=Caerostris extrusa TaxID=172846 RepID=A0AAV4M9I1_CAEEX|nr:hypothetical protein CEXT_646431 [Caerostris extrusa]